MKCYRLHRIGDKLFCPFFDLNPCHHGLHKLDIPKLPKKPKVKAKRKVKLLYHWRTLGSVCYNERKYIFERLRHNDSESNIARDLGIHTTQITSFIDSICKINDISFEDLKNIEIEE